MGHDAYINSAPYSADVVVFQKTYEPIFVKMADECKLRGIPAVFDMDDDYQCKQMLQRADMVTCDSQGLVAACEF